MADLLGLERSAQAAAALQSGRIPLGGQTFASIEDLLNRQDLDPRVMNEVQPGSDLGRRIGDRARELQAAATSPMAAEIFARARQFYGENPPPTEASDVTFGLVNRNALEMVGGFGGGVLGAAAGATGGPAAPATVPLGALAGSALGTGAGSAVYDGITDLLRGIGTLETPPNTPTGLARTGQILGTAGREAVTDAAYGAGFTALGTAIRAIKPGIGALLGVRTQEARAIQQQAERLGIGLGAIDTATGTGGRLIRGYAQVAGIFPFVSGPYRTSRSAIAGDIDAATSRILNSLAPNATMQGQLGVDMVAAAKGVRSEFVRVSGQLYDGFREYAANLSTKEVVPTQLIRNVAANLDAVRQAGAVRDRTTGELIQPEGGDPLGNYITKLNGLPDLVTVEQIRGLSDELEGYLGRLRNEGWDVRRVASIKQAMEDSLGAIRTDLLRPGEAATLLDLKEAADRFYTTGVVQFRGPGRQAGPVGGIGAFETPTAQQFGTVDRRIFGAGREIPGTKNADEIADYVTKLRGVERVKDLENLVGRPLMDQAGRLWIQEAVANSMKDGLLDPDAMRRIMSSVDRPALGQFIGTPQLQASENLLSIITRLQAAPNVARFLQRRLSLGGTAALAGAAAGGTMLGGSGPGLPGAIALLLATRYFAKLTANPDQLLALTRVAFMAPTGNETVRRAMIGRLYRQLTADDPAPPEQRQKE